MKKSILLFAALFFLCISNSYSQNAPNPGFENWDTTHLPDYEEPIGWTSNNPEFLTYPVTVTKSTDTCSGIYSTKITNVAYIDIGGNPAVQQGFMISGASYSSLQIGFPCTVRVQNVQVCFKYTRAGNDSAEISVKMRKWGFITPGQSADVTTNSSLIRIGQSSASFYTVTVPVIYRTIFPAPNAPDTAEISFSPSCYNCGAPATAGSTIWVDNVVLNYNNGTSDVFRNSSPVSVYPNPAKDEINFTSLPTASEIIRLIDITGREVSRISVQSMNQTMNLQNISAGIYVYEIISADNEILASGKVSVVE